MSHIFDLSGNKNMNFCFLWPTLMIKSSIAKHISNTKIQLVWININICLQLCETKKNYMERSLFFFFYYHIINTKSKCRWTAQWYQSNISVKGCALKSQNTNVVFKQLCKWIIAMSSSVIVSLIMGSSGIHQHFAL